MTDELREFCGWFIARHKFAKKCRINLYKFTINDVLTPTLPMGFSTKMGMGMGYQRVMGFTC